MLDYLRLSDQCRRITIDWVMDGFGRQGGCLDTEEGCDFCQAAAAVAEAGEFEPLADENTDIVAIEAVVNTR